MRKRYLVTYDIRHPKRLRRVFKVMRRFGDHLQYSVFRCTLDEMGLIRLKSALLAEMNAREDQVLFADLGPDDGRGAVAIETLGAPAPEPDDGPIIV